MIALPAAQPIPLKDGRWWIAARMFRQHCPACVLEIFIRPALVAINGRWCLAFDCPRCGFQSTHIGDGRYLWATDAEVIAWSHVIGPWALLSADPGPLVDRATRDSGRCKLPDSLRGFIYQRDGYACRICGAIDELTIDHIQAVSTGGSNSAPNLRTLCRPCNSRKGARSEGSLQ